MILLHLFDNSRVNPSILCVDPDSLVLRGGLSNFDFSFRSTRVETSEDLNTTITIKRAIIGPPAIPHIYGVSLVCR